jgi:hypothetical protein
MQCICEKPVLQPVGKGRTRKYCSDRCRKRAQREREAGGDVTKIPVTKEAIRLYCGIGEVAYNRHPVACGSYACVSPVCGRDDREVVTESSRRNVVSVPSGVQVLQDSGAFSDGPKHRLSYAEALQRQIDHAKHYKYASQVTHRASYDLLIDETWKDEFRQKERWSEQAGMFAVKATVEAAAYLDAHRSRGIGCVMSAQGVTVEQYVECTEKVLQYVDVDQDIFGLGGWCILGKRSSLLPLFRETMQQVIPLVASHKVKRVHIWGVCFTEGLGPLLWLCDQYGLQLSTDSVGPSTRPTRGEWGYGSWRDPSYRKPMTLPSCKVVNAGGYKAPACSAETHCMGLERARHVALTREWLAHFREREPRFYQPVMVPAYRQLSLREANAWACSETCHEIAVTNL